MSEMTPKQTRKTAVRLKAAEDFDPRLIKTAADRGMAFRLFLANRDLKLQDFVQASGVGKSTLARYFNGTYDVAGVSAEIASRIITAMGVSDEVAWEKLAIPEEQRATFRSLRPAGLGSGPALFKTRPDVLTTPLLGRAVLPEDTTIRLDPENTTRGIQIIRLSDGRMFAAPAAAIIGAEGERLGRLVSAVFAED